MLCEKYDYSIVQLFAEHKGNVTFGAVFDSTQLSTGSV